MSTQNHDEPRRRRVFFIAYTFPPVGGAGVQRTTKFTKYLPHFGWDASVLTVSNPSVPVTDATLTLDLPPSMQIIRARTFEPSYAAKRVLAGTGRTSSPGAVFKSAARRTLLSLLQPDPQMLWNVPAFRAGVRALRQTKHDVIVASAPPFSSLLLGAALSRYTGVPLVLDYRDEWEISTANWENRHRGPISVAVQRRMERYALRRAKAVVATSPGSATALTALCRNAGSAASVTHIYNGFDPDDFAGPVSHTRPGDSRLWRLVYTGTLYNLVSSEPLVKAIEDLAATQPETAARIELVFAGRRTPEQDRFLQRLAGVCRLQTHEYVSHEKAIALMRSSDALCVLLSDVPGAGRVVPAKVFEYIACRKPILAVAPPGDVWDLLKPHPAVFMCPPDNTYEIRQWLAKSVAGGTRWPERGAVDTQPFNRRFQAQQLALLLNSVRTAGSADSRVAGVGSPVPRKDSAFEARYPS